MVDTDTGKFKIDHVRTSSGTFLKRGQDDIIKRLEHRIAEWTRLPVENGEPFHILRYQVSSGAAVGRGGCVRWHVCGQCSDQAVHVQSLKRAGGCEL